MAQAAIPLALSAASSGLKLMGDNQQAKGQYAASMFEAQKLRRAAENARLKAEQTDVFMRNELNTTMANIDAIRAMTGTSAASPTQAALKQAAGDVSDRERITRRFSELSQADQMDRDAAWLGLTARKNLLRGRNIGLLNFAGGFAQSLGAGLGKMSFPSGGGSYGGGGD